MPQPLSTEVTGQLLGAGSLLLWDSGFEHNRPVQHHQACRASTLTSYAVMLVPKAVSSPSVLLGCLSASEDSRFPICSY